jgi:peptidoglycan/LPS O-acetylase OafA/YrhL
MAQGATGSNNLVLHVLALQAWSPDLSVAFGLNGPGWSIGVEFFLYACFPLVAIAFARFERNRRLLWLFALVVVIMMALAALFSQLSGRAAWPISYSGSAHRWLYRTPVTRLGDFILGTIAALLFRNRESGTRSEGPWNLVAYASVVGIISLMLWPANLLSAYSWDVSYAPLAFLLIVGLSFAPQTLIGRFLASHSIVALGEASFALYLIHVPLMSIFDIPRYTAFEPWIAIPLWVSFAAICIALATTLNVYVETPLRRIIRNWADKATSMHSGAWMTK